MGLVGKLPPTAVINFGADPIGGGVVWNHCSRETMKNGNLLFEISPICNPFQFKCDFLFRLFCLRGCNSQFLFLNYGANLIYYPLKRGAVRELYFRCYFFWRASTRLRYRVSADVAGKGLDTGAALGTRQTLEGVCVEIGGCQMGCMENGQPRMPRLSR